MIVQYNTNRGLVTNDIVHNLKNIKRSSNRRKCRSMFLSSKSSCFNTPNKITSKDFEGWVQQGLYIIQMNMQVTYFHSSSNDEGEKTQQWSFINCSLRQRILYLQPV
jgi:hypothetical protein